MEFLDVFACYGDCFFEVVWHFALCRVEFLRRHEEVVGTRFVKLQCQFPHRLVAAVPYRHEYVADDGDDVVGFGGGTA